MDFQLVWDLTLLQIGAGASYNNTSISTVGWTGPSARRLTLQSQNITVSSLAVLLRMSQTDYFINMPTHFCRRGALVLLSVHTSLVILSDSNILYVCQINAAVTSLIMVTYSTFDCRLLPPSSSFHRPRIGSRLMEWINSNLFYSTSLVITLWLHVLGWRRTQ